MRNHFYTVTGCFQSFQALSTFFQAVAQTLCILSENHSFLVSWIAFAVSEQCCNVFIKVTSYLQYRRQHFNLSFQCTFSSTFCCEPICKSLSPSSFYFGRNFHFGLKWSVVVASVVGGNCPNISKDPTVFSRDIVTFTPICAPLSSPMSYFHHGLVEFQQSPLALLSCPFAGIRASNVIFCALCVSHFLR